MNRAAAVFAFVLGPFCFSGLADDFSLSPPSGTVTLNTNSAAPYLVTITCPYGSCRSGAITVNFSATVAPSGPALSFSPTSVTTWTSASSNLFINTGATPPGSYTITVTATGAGYQHTATINLTVQAYTGTYQFFRNDPLNPSNSLWVQSGTPFYTASGLTDHCSNPYDPSGCYIPGNGASLTLPAYPGIPDGTNDYEIRMSLHLPDQTSYAQFQLTARGGAYQFVMNSPTYTNGICTADFQLLKQVPTQTGTNTTVLSDFPHSCAEGMSMRLMVKGSEIKVSLDGGFFYSFTDTQFPTGLPGIGIIGPDQDTISGVQIGILDRQPPPAVSGATVGVSAFPTRVDLQWQAVQDNTSGGIGLQGYNIYRDGAFIGFSAVPTFTDESVTSGSNPSYTVTAFDQHDNFAPGASFNVSVPATGPAELRRTGVRSTGSYWGDAGEQIDVLSGNLNFTVPLLKAQARGGWGVALALSYNSQMWRQDGGGTWKFGRDVGYGEGWLLQAGAVRPVWNGLNTIHHYVFIDPTGAEYRLDQNNGGVWTSQQGAYVSFDSNTNRLYFPDGSFWVMGGQSSGGEDDAGWMHPTVLNDTNGNQLQIIYGGGIGSGLANSSARIYYINDVRINWGPSYTFQYNNDPIPHLIGIVNALGTAEKFTLAYLTGQTLSSPLSSSTYGTTTLLQSLGVTGLGVSHQFQYYAPSGGATSAELTSMTTPLGGVLQWQHGTQSDGSGHNYRAVQVRQMTPLSGASQYTWNVATGASSGTIADLGAGTHKTWTFQTGTGPFAGFATSYEERDASNIALLHKDYTWTQDTAGNVYVGSVTSTLNPGTSYAAQSKTAQTLDIYGNVTTSQVFDFNNLTTPARTYNFSYLTDSNYTSRYIRNRLSSATVTAGGVNTTLLTSYYDNASNSCGVMQDQSGNYLHDDTNYGTSFTYRGNLTWSNNVGDVRCTALGSAGLPYHAQDGAGHTVDVTASASTNFSMPGVITPGGSSALSTSLTYANSFAVTSSTGANGATASATYDNYGRLATSTIADGATTNYAYTFNPNTATATVNGRWTKTTVDGFGRTTRVETGHDTVTVSTVDTQYAPCACSPLGKLSRFSQPYAPGGTPVWTTYTYDGSGRTLSVTTPDGSVTSTSYQGVSTTVTDAAGKWKTFTNDAMGNLLTVTEPDPGGGANLITSYTYDVLNHLTGVSMPRNGYTQTRSFTWSGMDMISATNPENGTITYQYDGAHHVTQRTDAKGQQTRYTYDSLGRLTSTRHYTLVNAVPTEQTKQAVTYYWGDTDPSKPCSTGSNARLSRVIFGNEATTTPEQFTYKYCYNTAGRISQQTLFIDTGVSAGPGPSGNITYSIGASYTRDNEGRVLQRYGPDATFNYQYDAMGRVSTMKDSLQNPIAIAAYGPANEILSLTYDGYTETRTYNSHLQLTRMAVPGAMDMQYIFSPTQNNGRITQSIDGITGEQVSYTYDSLNRLIGAQTADNLWGNAYTYDGFGNLTAKTVTKGSAPTFSGTFDPATNRQNGVQYDASGNPAVNGTFPYDVENRLVQPNGSGTGPSYGYDPNGKRFFKFIPGQNGNPDTCEIYLYDLDGKKLSTLSCQGLGTTSFTATLTTSNLYFAGKLIRSNGVTVITDRLGSVRANGNGERMAYFPYGEERTSTLDSREKFATYFRDDVGTDYAGQRYYVNSVGRFTTSDPLAPASAALAGRGKTPSAEFSSDSRRIFQAI